MMAKVGCYWNLMGQGREAPQGGQGMEAPQGCEVNVDYLPQSQINDPSVPFGHGYLLAGALLGIDPDVYTQ